MTRAAQQRPSWDKALPILVSVKACEQPFIAGCSKPPGQRVPHSATWRRHYGTGMNEVVSLVDSPHYGEHLASEGGVVESAIPYEALQYCVGVLSVLLTQQRLARPAGDRNGWQFSASSLRPGPVGRASPQRHE